MKSVLFPTSIILSLATVFAALVPSTALGRPPGRPGASWDAVIVPLRNLSSHTVEPQVYDAIVAEFEENNFHVAPRVTVQSALHRLGIISSSTFDVKEFHRLARELRARYVVTGTIEQYRATKKFRVGGFLLSPIGGSTTTYGTVQISSQIYDVEENRVIWDQSEKNTKKRQIFGLFSSKDKVTEKALRAVIDHLYKSFFASL